MSNLSELLPAGGTVGATDFTADGAVIGGKPVIMNSDGTVSAIAESDITQAAPASGGAFVDWWTSGTQYTSSYTYRWDMSVHPADNTKAVIAARENSSGVCCIVTRSGNTVTVGSLVTFKSGGSCDYIKVACGKVANQFVVYYKERTGSQYLKCRVGTIDGDSCTFGNETTVISSNLVYTFMAADPNNDNKYILGYKDSSTYFSAKVGTVSGTGISFGSALQFTSSWSPEHTDCCFDPSSGSGKFAILTNRYNDEPLIVQTTYSGTTIASSASATWTNCNDDTGKDIRGHYDASSGDLVISYRDRGSPYYGCVRVIEGNGTKNTKVVTSSVALTGQGVQCTDVAGDPDNTTKFCTTYSKISGDDTVYLRSFTTSGSSGSKTCTLDSELTVVSAASGTGTSPYLTGYGDAQIDYWGDNSKIALIYAGAGGDSEEYIGVCQAAGSTETNMTSSNLVGVSSAAISDTATGTINTWGSLNDVQSSLTIGSDYYAQGDGTLSTTSTSPAQLIGTAINATTINIKDYTG